MLAQTAPPATTPQPTDPTAPTAAPTPSQAREAWEREFGDLPTWRYRHNVFRVGQDYLLREGATTRDVAVVFGSARIAGRVEGDVVVVFGTAELTSSAIVEGSFVVVGGEAVVAPGALVRRDVVTIGTAVQMPTDFVFGGEHIAVGTTALGLGLRNVTPWVTGGLLLGRPIVPSLSWVWTIVGIFLLVYVLVNVLLHEPVRSTTEVLARRPFGAFMVGLLMLLLWAPISALLAVSVVGIIVIPFFLAALVVAFVVGRVGVMRWIGNSVLAADDPDSRVLAFRSFLLGFVLITLIYMVPLLGLVAWGLVGVFGLGAAVMAFLSAWRKETPAAGPTGPAGPAGPAGPVKSDGPPPPVASAVPAVPAAPVEPVEPVSPVGPDRPLATFLERAAAFGLDALMVGVLHEGLRGWFLPRYSDAYFPLLLIYFIGFWTWKGTTVGGIIMKLRIVKLSRAPFEASDAIVRGLAGVLSFAAVGLGVLWILRDPQRQAWHDKAVGTVVVKDPTT
jgi:uncharacterized RDD family membrane protein YckC